MSGQALVDERWLPVVGFEEAYEVSDLGRVRRIGAAPGAVVGRILRPLFTPKGYIQVSLSGQQKKLKKSVHLIVLEAFVGPRPADGIEGCHNDGDKSNNRLDNLRWDTSGNNKRDAVAHRTHIHSRKEVCPRNHVLAEPNLVESVLRDGRRNCLACARARARVRKYGGDVQELSDSIYIKLMEEK